ncbi:MAG: hypothetical protein ABIF84_00825 [Patescibacteria group bacterium]
MIKLLTHYNLKLMAFYLSLLILGFTCLISQVILLRELMVSFYGNEFFLGLILAAWLFWVGLGSYWLAKLFKKQSLKIVLSCHILAVFLLPLLIILIRLSKTWVLISGQIPDLLPSLILGIFIPLPLCLIFGLQFTKTSQYLNQFNPARSVNQAYLIESLGFVIAGLAFSFFLILFNIWISISLLGIINLLAVLIIISNFNQKKYLFFRIISLIFLFAFVFLNLPQLNHYLEYQTQAWRFPKQKLIKLVDSPYGQIEISQTKDQFNFYQNGLWLGSSQEAPFNESLTHFSLLAHPSPKKILLIGYGFQGIIKEILKHQPEEIYYLEIDPWLITAVWPYLSADSQASLLNDRVHIFNQDGRAFLKQNLSQKFDVVLINLPDPSTALINRFYTQEIFETINNKLKPNGLLATYLSFSPNFQNQDLIKLEASIYQTLKRFFSEILVLPEEGTVIFLAGQEQIQTDSLFKNWQQRKIETKFINLQYLAYVFNGQRAQETKQVLNQTSAKINQDNYPIAYAYNFLFWTNYFHPQLADFLSGFLKIDFWYLLILPFLTLAFLLNKKSTKDSKLWWTMMLAGFSLMSLEILLILVYQSLFGYLYYRLALLISLFMFGLALGIWLGNRKKQINLKIKQIHFLIIIFIFLIYLLLWSQSLNYQIFFFGLAILIGGIVGLEFFLINQTYFKKQKKPWQTGFIYSADLIGSCLGALITALFLIPLFGIYQTLIFLIATNLLVIILPQKH